MVLALRATEQLSAVNDRFHASNTVSSWHHEFPGDSFWSSDYSAVDRVMQPDYIVVVSLSPTFNMFCFLKYFHHGK